MTDEQRVEIEAAMVDYCLMLPWVDKTNDNNSEYAVVFHDWCIHSFAYDMKLLPDLCPHVFQEDIMKGY